MRSFETRLTTRLGLRFPLVQAPMAGSASPALVAAVSAAGALGSLGAAYLQPDELRAAISRVRSLTDAPFAVNVFAWPDADRDDDGTLERVVAALRPHRRRVGLDDPERPEPARVTALLEAQLAIVAQERVPVLSFTFGIPPLESAKAAGVFTVGTATTVREAVELERAGVDAVVAQGSEAGGHRGTFVTSPGHPLVGLAALVPQVVDAVDVPVIAAGGLMDGRGIAAALALGADAAQLGTAFLVAHESAAHPTYKRAVLEAADDATVVTDAYTGRPARAVATPLIAELDGLGHVLPFPAQGLLTRDMHAAAAERGRPELMFLLSGQGTRLARALPAGELVRTLADETEAVLRRLTG